MIDATTGRFCLAHSIEALWHDGNIVAALYGLPARTEIKQRPLTDLLCSEHQWRYLHRLLTLPQRDQDGHIQRYPNGQPAHITAAAIAREYWANDTSEITQIELLALLERMEEGLRMLEASYRRAQLLSVIVEEPTTVLPSANELIANSLLHARIYDYLNPIAGSTSTNAAADLPPPQVPQNSGSWTLADFPFNDSIGPNPDDLISGEE